MPDVETVVDRCRGCRSPFLRHCTADGWAACRSCGRVVRLGRRERFPEVFATGVVTTIEGHGDPKSGPVLHLATRWTVRGAQCRFPVAAKEAG